MAKQNLNEAFERNPRRTPWNKGEQELHKMRAAGASVDQRGRLPRRSFRSPSLRMSPLLPQHESLTFARSGWLEVTQQVWAARRPRFSKRIWIAASTRSRRHQGGLRPDLYEPSAVSEVRGYLLADRASILLEGQGDHDHHPPAAARLQLFVSARKTGSTPVPHRWS
jgi:hypothetical protein